MGVRMNVGYYGPSINSETEAFKQYDLACPNVCKGGQKNFWKHRCLERIGNRDIPSCFKGCKEAAKHPELKHKMDRVIEAWDKDRIKRELHEKQLLSQFNKIRYREGIERSKRKPQLSTKDRAKIISMYLSGQSVRETILELKCGRTAVSLYRKMYREEAITKAGKITL